jgi:prepilin-type N-terminal cleavage/methylation domain-containing protein
MKKHKGYTLLELLGTTAVIAVLAGMTLPALSGAREKARRTICANNQRQIVLAMNMYAQDYEGFLPIGIGFSSILSNNQGEKSIFGGLCPSYLKSLEVFYCPSQERFSKNNPETGAQNFGVPSDRGCFGSYVTFKSMYDSEGIIKKHDPKNPLISDMNSPDDGNNPPLVSHKGRGVNVGYIGGGVIWYSGSHKIGYTCIPDSCKELKLK